MKHVGLGMVRVPLPAGVDRAAVSAALLGRADLWDFAFGEDTVGIWFDPLGAVPDVAEALEARGRSAAAGEIVVEVRYGGPDLDRVAAWAGIPAAEVVERHAAAVYEVKFHGFVAKFAYLGDVDPAIAAPRLEVPRQVVPVGAIGIAGTRTGVYPGGTPGGWNLVGSADRPLPVTRVGDHVRFVPR